MKEIKKLAEKARFEWLHEVLKPNASVTVSCEGAFGTGFEAGFRKARELSANEAGLAYEARRSVDETYVRIMNLGEAEAKP